ncbi:spatacsin [Nematostella vectensis]|uniref:spatacsin n=1 Tax=Nematostella vectensis TaxID=45351 RepID=UPI0020770B59|nr:spatacsin [Nematostella vectensis]
MAEKSFLVAVKKFTKNFNVLSAKSAKVSPGYRILGLVDCNGCLRLRNVSKEREAKISQVKSFGWSTLREAIDSQVEKNVENSPEDFLLSVNMDNSIEIYSVKTSSDDSHELNVKCDVSSSTDMLKGLLRDRGKDCEIEDISLVTITTNSTQGNHLVTLLVNQKFIMVVLINKTQSAKIQSCFAVNDSSTLPVLVPVSSLVQVKIVQSVVFGLFSSGMTIIHNIEGQYLGYVDINSFHSIDKESPNEAQTNNKQFLHLDITPNLTLLVASDNHNNLYTINLDDYFKHHPEHLHHKSHMNDSNKKRMLLKYETEDEDMLLRDARTSDVTYGDRVWKTEYVSIRDNVSRIDTLTGPFGEAVCPTNPLKGRRWFQEFKDPPSGTINHPEPNPPVSKPRMSGFLLKSRKSSRSVTSSSESSASLRSMKENLGCGVLNLESKSTFIAAEPWVKSMTIRGLFASSDSLLVWLVPMADEVPLTGFEFPHGLVSLFGYQGQEMSDRLMFLEPMMLVENCSSLQPLAFLSRSVLSIPSFGINQNQLVHQVIMYENAALAELVCHINHWDNCVIPLEALQVSLKHRQLDTVAFFLKNQENVFTRSTSPPLPSPSASLSPQSTSSSPGGKCVPVAMDTSQTQAIVNTLVNSVKKNALQQHNLHFTSQLLQMTLRFLHCLMQDGSRYLNKLQVEEVTPLSGPGASDKAAARDHRKPVNVAVVEETMVYISRCIVEMRKFLMNIPDDSIKQADPRLKQVAFLDTDVEQEDPLFSRWTDMKCKDVVLDAVIGGHISKAQTFFMNNANIKEPECDGSLSSFTAMALNLVLRALVAEDLDTAVTILTNIGRDRTVQLRSICFNTLHRPLRDLLVKELVAEGNFSDEELNMVKFIHALEALYNQQNLTVAKDLSTYSTSWTDPPLIRNSFNVRSRQILESHIQTGNLLPEHFYKVTSSRGYSESLLEWIRTWDQEARQRILLERMLSDQDSSSTNLPISARAIWNYFCSRCDWLTLRDWVQATSWQLRDPTGPRDMTESRVRIGDALKVTNRGLVLPSLSRDVYSNFPVCLSLMKEFVVDELTRQGMFSSEQLSNFDLLTSHLGRTSLLFTHPHPFSEGTVPSYPRGTPSPGMQIMSLREFHGRFIAYCAEKELINVLYYYLDFYKLAETEEDVRQLGLHGTKPDWLNTMIHFRLAARHTHDLSSVYYASLSNARCVLNTEAPTVSDMLKAGCTVMALATLVYAPQNITQTIIPAGSDPVHPEWQVEDTLLRKSLTSHPKLLSALFPVVTSGGMELQDVTVYQLLQGNSPFDVSRMFGWQQTNELAVKADMACEMPHFSLAPLVSQYAHVETLTFSYYLRHGRPSFAFAAFIGAYLKERSIPRVRITSAAKKAYRVAIQQFNEHQVSSACVAFTEMLGVDSACVRIDLQAANRILAYAGREGIMESECPEGGTLKDRIVSELITCAGRSSSRQPVTLLRALEEATYNLISRECIERTSHEASQLWLLVVLFCRVHKLDLSTAFLVDCAKMDKWLQFACFAQLCQYPKHQVLDVVGHHFSNRHYREHLLLAFDNVQVIQVEGTGDTSRKRGSKKSRRDDLAAPRNVRAQFYSRMGLKVPVAEDDDVRAKSKPKSTSDQGSSSATEGAVTSEPERPGTSCKTERHERPIDPNTVSDHLLDVLFECQSAHVPWRALLAHSIALRRPVLAVLAACHEDAKSLDCLCVWLHASLDPSVLDSFTESTEDIEWRRWSLDHLSNIIIAIVSHREKYAATLAKAVYMFDPKSPLLYFARFIESFVVRSDYEDCFTQLDLFKKTYLKLLSTKTPRSSGGTCDVTWLEGVTSQVTQHMLRQCVTSYTQAHLLGLLAKTMFGRNFSCYVPRYYTLNQICKITRETDVKIDFSALLHEDSKPAENEKYRVLQELLRHNHFSQAREYAKLLDLPADDVTLNEVLHEKKSIENSVLWDISQGRLAFWHKANQCFTDNRCSPQVAGAFFESQADDPDLSYKEKSRLLSMALNWYSSKDEPADQTVTAELERQIWLCCIKAEIEKTKEARLNRSISHLEFLPETSEWSLELPKVQRAGSLIEAEPSMTNELIQPETVECSTDMANLLQSDVEFVALERVICQLLERCHVTQCRRLAAQFGHKSQDLDVVVACIHLAQGTRFSDTLDESIRQLLTRKPHRRISTTSRDGLRRSGSFVLGTSLKDGNRSMADDSISVDWVQVEDTITTMEALVYYCQSGKRCCARIITCYKISQTLGLEYERVVADKPFNVLHSLLVSGFDTRYKLAENYIKAFELSAQEVVGFLNDIILHSLRVYTGEELSGSSDDLIFNAAPSCDDVTQVIRLCSDQALLGNRLLDTAVDHANDREEAGSRDNKGLSLEVELLVRAHECHTMACNMEGISRVLKCGRQLTTALADAEEYRLMVRLLTGVGRFREMSYIFDTLIQHLHFELLVQTGIDKENKLKVALLEYLKRCHPDDAEKYTMVAMHFNMFREIAETWEKSAQTQLYELRNQQIVLKPELQAKLNSTMRFFCYAADYYSKEGCSRHSQKCLNHARLVQLQVHLLPSGVRVINLEGDEAALKKFLKQHTHFFEALLVADAYDKRGPGIWVDSVYSHVVLAGDFKYWQDLKSVMAPSSLLFVDVANKYKNDSPRSSQAMANMKKLLGHLPELRVRYRIAVDLGFRDMSANILDSDGGAYLRDVMIS